jgi:membrane protease YdiL (CAAX protease family)
MELSSASGWIAAVLLTGVLLLFADADRRRWAARMLALLLVYLAAFWLATAIVPPTHAGIAALAAGAAVLLAVQPLIALGLVDRTEIGLAPPRAGSAAPALIAIVLGVAFNVLVMKQREPLPLQVTGIASVLLAAPMIEEFVFRGVLLALADRASPPRWNVLGARIGTGGVLLTLAFIALHGLRPGMLLGIAPAALLYLWMRARTGSLLWPIAAHAAWNLAVIVVHRP